jgi:hypothetical protein
MTNIQPGHNGKTRLSFALEQVYAFLISRLAEKNHEVTP